MQRTLAPLVFVLTLSACYTLSGPAGSAEQLAGDEIPRGATAVRIHSNLPPADLYRALYRQLASEGYSIEQENAEMGTLSTGFRDIESQTTSKVIAFVDDAPGGSVATLRGRWGVSASFAAGMSAALGAEVGDAAEQAKWTSGRPKIAFRELVEMAKALPSERIEYAGE